MLMDLLSLREKGGTETRDAAQSCREEKARGKSCAEAEKAGQNPLEMSRTTSGGRSG